MTHTLSRLLVVGDTVCFRDGREFRVDRISDRSSIPVPYVQGHPESISGAVTIYAGPTGAYYVNVPFADSWAYGRGTMSYQSLVSGSDSRDDILAIAKTSEDDSANARILFAKDLVPDEFKRIQEEAFRFLPTSPIATTPPPRMSVERWIGIADFARAGAFDLASLDTLGSLSPENFRPR